MRCYACNRPVSEENWDKPTGRYYCTECFIPTIEEQFKALGDWEGSIKIVEEYVTEEEQEPQEETEEQEEWESF